jgi:hypothetical protein
MGNCSNFRFHLSNEKIKELLKDHIFTLLFIILAINFVLNINSQTKELQRISKQVNDVLAFQGNCTACDSTKMSKITPLFKELAK